MAFLGVCPCFQQAGLEFSSKSSILEPMNSVVEFLEVRNDMQKKGGDSGSFLNEVYDSLGFCR